MRTLFLTTAALAALMIGAPIGQAHAAGDKGQWWNFDHMANACLNDETPQEQVGTFKDHGINDVTLNYVKTERGEMMYAKIRATDNGDFLNYVTLYHSYHKNGKLLTGKQSCEDIEDKPRERLANDLPQSRPASDQGAGPHQRGPKAVAGARHVAAHLVSPAG